MGGYYSAQAYIVLMSRNYVFPYTKLLMFTFNWLGMIRNLISAYIQPPTKILCVPLNQKIHMNFHLKFRNAFLARAKLCQMRKNLTSHRILNRRDHRYGATRMFLSMNIDLNWFMWWYLFVKSLCRTHEQRRSNFKIGFKHQLVEKGDALKHCQNNY